MKGTKYMDDTKYSEGIKCAEDTKYRILDRLKKHKGEFVSGEKLGELLDVSRSAVWKAIGELRKDGYNISSSSRKGYMYKPSDVLNAFELGEVAGTVFFCGTVDSTNDVAKKLARETQGEGILVVADRQTSGKGRMGREWISPAGKGIWMSVVFKPQIAPEEAQVMTLAASVAVAGAIEEVTGLVPGIKWPNDVILSGRKVCGILTEMNAETDRIHFLVIGIGINFSQEDGDFPGELRDKAVSLKSAFRKANNGKDGEFARIDIIRKTVENLNRLYDMVLAGQREELADKWRKYSVTLGKRIRIRHAKGEYGCFAQDITPNGELVVRLDDGSVKKVFSAEVSIGSGI